MPGSAPGFKAVAAPGVAAAAVAGKACAGLTDASAGALLMPAGSGSFDSVVTTSPSSVKYWRLTAWRSSGVSASSVR